MIELKKALELAKQDSSNLQLRVQLNYRLGTMLHWIMVYWERVIKIYYDIPEDVQTFFSALKYANNQMKHEPTLTEFTQRSGGFSFPISFPLTIMATQFIWHLNSSNATRYENQRANFEKQLENKEVMETISKAIEILKEYQLV
jgi:hypothetical protein